MQFPSILDQQTVVPCRQPLSDEKTRVLAVKRRPFRQRGTLRGNNWLNYVAKTPSGSVRAIFTRRVDCSREGCSKNVAIIRSGVGVPSRRVASAWEKGTGDPGLRWNNKNGITTGVEKTGEETEDRAVNCIVELSAREKKLEGRAPGWNLQTDSSHAGGSVLIHPRGRFGRSVRSFFPRSEFNTLSGFLPVFRHPRWPVGIDRGFVSSSRGNRRGNKSFRVESFADTRDPPLSPSLALALFSRCGSAFSSLRQDCFVYYSSPRYTFIFPPRNVTFRGLILRWENIFIRFPRSVSVNFGGSTCSGFYGSSWICVLDRTLLVCALVV